MKTISKYHCTSKRFLILFLFSLLLLNTGNVTSTNEPLTAPSSSQGTPQLSDSNPTKLGSTAEIRINETEEVMASPINRVESEVITENYDGLEFPPTTNLPIVPFIDNNSRSEFCFDNIEHTFLIWPSYVGKMALQFERPFCIPESVAFYNGHNLVNNNDSDSNEILPRAVKEVMVNSSNLTTDAIMAGPLHPEKIKPKLESIAIDTFMQIKKLMKSNGLVIIDDIQQDDIEIIKSDVDDKDQLFRNGSIVAFSKNPFNWTLRYDIAPTMYHAERELPYLDKYTIFRNNFTLCDWASVPYSRIPERLTYHYWRSGAKIQLELRFDVPFVVCGYATATYAHYAMGEIEDILRFSEYALEGIMTEIGGGPRDPAIRALMRDVVFRGIKRVLLSYGLLNPVEGRSFSSQLEYDEETTYNGHAYSHKGVFHDPFKLTLLYKRTVW